MDNEHIPVETLRAYLLGALTDEDAAAVEQKYFVSKTCLQQVQAVERALIEGYLDGTLAPGETRQFEVRYLHNPARRRLVEEAKRRRIDSAHPNFGLGWRFAGIAASLCIVAACGWIYWDRRPAPGPESNDLTPRPTAQVVSLRLAPGITMGSGGKTARLELPRKDSPVQLIAELPGVPSAVKCSARLSVVGADAKLTPIRAIDAALTTRGNGGQELSMLLAPLTLHPGDYILEVTESGRAAPETYLFHVASGPSPTLPSPSSASPTSPSR